MLENAEKKSLSLSDYKGKYVVLLFYPVLSPYEIIQFDEKVADFRANNCELIGISTDTEFNVKNWLKTPRESGGLGKIYMPLISDQSPQKRRILGTSRILNKIYPEKITYAPGRKIQKTSNRCELFGFLKKVIYTPSH